MLLYVNSVNINSDNITFFKEKNMSNFTIITDSSCDLSDSLAKELELKVVPLSVFSGSQQYYNYLDGSDIGFEEFYTRLAGGEMMTTSAINIDQMYAVMSEELKEGRDVLYIGFSSGLSGTYNAGVQAARLLSEEYPERKIFTVDSLCASLGQGLLVYLCAMHKKEGKTVEEIYEYAEGTKMNVCPWFTVDDLFHLKRGGRVSGVTAAVGSMLNIKPVMHVDNAGKLINVSKARGRNASITALFDKMCESGIDLASQKIFISHGNCLADAEKLAKMINDKFGCEVIINYVGPVIGAHSGQGTLALFFLGKER